MKPSLYLLIPALFLVSCDQQEDYDDCITDSMQGVSSDVAARAIIEACQNKFPTEPPGVVDAARLVIRNEITYEINSDTPFTGVSLAYYANRQVKERATFKDGKQNGLSEEFSANGQLWFSADYRDGLIDAPDYSDLEDRGDVRYEIGSDTPYTGVVIVHDGESLAKGNLYRGVPDGVSEEYNQYGTLRSRDFYKDGERIGSCNEPGCTDFD